MCHRLVHHHSPRGEKEHDYCHPEQPLKYRVTSHPILEPMTRAVLTVVLQDLGNRAVRRRFRLLLANFEALHLRQDLVFECGAQVLAYGRSGVNPGLSDTIFDRKNTVTPNWKIFCSSFHAHHLTETLDQIYTSESGA